jgi:dihydroxyacetone kinase
MCLGISDLWPLLEHLHSSSLHPAPQVGDGDCGDTLLAGARAILSDLSAHYPLNDTAATLAAVAQSVRHAVGGTSGALYDVGLTAAARGYKVGGACVHQRICHCSPAMMPRVDITTAI